MMGSGNIRGVYIVWPPEGLLTILYSRATIICPVWCGGYWSDLVYVMSVEVFDSVLCDDIFFPVHFCKRYTKV
jgi:hypothetical protein